MDDSRTILTRDTLLPISVVGASIVFAYVIGGDRQRIDARLERIEELLVHISNNNVSHNDFHIWRADLRAMNPELQIPPLPHSPED